MFLQRAPIKENNQAFSDLFFYDLDKDENQLLGRLTNTPFANETYPEILDSNYYSYLSDVNGVSNLYRGRMSKDYQYTLYNYTFKDSNNDVIPYVAKESLDYANTAPFNTFQLIDKSSTPVSQWIGYNSPISSEYSGILEIDKAKKSFLFTQLKKGKPTLRLRSIDSLNLSLKNLTNTSYRNSIDKKYNILKKDTVALSTSKNDTIIIPPAKKQFFQTEFDYLSDTNLFKDNTAARESYQRVKVFMMQKNEVYIDSTVNYRFSKTRPYFTRFFVSQVNININNALLIDRYQKYPNPRTVPQYSPMIQFGIKDLFENYHIYGGFRVAFDLNANEVFIALENGKKRWEKRYTFLRRALTQEYKTEDKVDSTVKYVSNYIDFLFSYPIDYTQSISINTGFKTDKNTLKVTTIEELNSKPLIENWIYVRPEYVFDNTIMRQLNIPNGTKFKAFVEFYKEIPTKPLEITKGFDLPIPQWNEGYFINWGFDFRHYQPVSKNIIWATRMMYSSSIGTRKMLYQIGGTEGEIFPTYDNSSIVNPLANYAFQSYANNLRGFMQNTRNGNNVAIMNTELRIPILSYLIKKPLKNAFLRNFQITTFVDIGMAWNGFNPYSRENPFYIKPFTNGITTINANYLKNPMVGSTGFGLRSSLLGYFLKVDFGLGFDSGKFNNKLYTNWSVSMDF
ncbi:MAG: hypothetical protein IPK03_16415 [Bacteroidetes bacterium]|nr:hypothetical protein [Bacteroidota bacterium]